MIYKKEFRDFAVKDQGISGSNVDWFTSWVENMTRSVIEERPTNFREIDVFSRLMMDRIIFLGLAIDDNISNIVTAQLLFLESTDPKKDILMYINCPGGSVYAGFGIYDTMQYVGPDVSTICTGLAASFGAILLTGGADNKRSALPHARIMLHQPLGGVQGQASDIEITAKQILIIKKELNEIISKHSGKSVDDIEKHSDRDYWLKADEAKSYGLIDEILVKHSK
ncbi:MAG: ATP-dependent Clp protease proteolytic subunit [Bacteroidetes bacterium]|nr:ATP-dependent Clp protease proteolytic subunit [Bacteroidota bacterium]MCZ6899637.1 ATP-dependent Clp protease proteolytic subunit [Bacteroidota bacterium]